jgi:hypothetical protein
MDSRKFEDSWKDAFERAELQPSDNAWTNIELELEKAEGGTIKRRLLFYKLLAAASMTFALALAGVGFYYMSVKDQSRQVATANGPESAGPATDQSSPEVSALQSTGSGDADHRGSVDTNEVQKANDEAPQRATATNTPGVNDATQALAGPSNAVRLPSALPVNGSDNTTNLGVTPFAFSPDVVQEETHRSVALSEASRSKERSLTPLYVVVEPKLNFDESEPDAGALLLARLASEELAFAEEDKRQKAERDERLWTSVGMSAGAFSAMNAGVTGTQANTAFANNASTVPDQQARASGYAYSFGVNIGAKVAKRWVLMGGVNYLTQSSDYVATNVVADNNFKTLKAESINQLDMLQSNAGSTSRLAPTFPYNVNNNVQFFSVPVQAGYLVVNNRFGLQMNAGLSTDLFLQNTITPEGGSLDKTTQGSGDESPYRTVNFSGLMGTELSYRFGHRYRLSVNPGLRYPLNSVYKSDVGVSSSPLTFDVGLRFRYIFR